MSENYLEKELQHSSLVEPPSPSRLFTIQRTVQVHDQFTLTVFAVGFASRRIGKRHLNKITNNRQMKQIPF